MRTHSAERLHSVRNYGCRRHCRLTPASQLYPLAEQHADHDIMAPSHLRRRRPKRIGIEHKHVLFSSVELRRFAERPSPVSASVKPNRAASLLAALLTLALICGRALA